MTNENDDSVPPELTQIRSTSTIPDVPEEFSVTTKSLDNRISAQKEKSKDAFKLTKDGSMSKYL